MAVLALAAIAAAPAQAQTQDLPRIAVYVSGDIPDNEKRALGTRMLATLINSGRYRGMERSNAFIAELDKEQTKQGSGVIDDSQISELGKQFGVGFVCIADVTPAFGSYQVSARIVDAETAGLIFIGESFSPLKTVDDLAQVSDQVVKNMFGEHAASAQASKPESTPATAKPAPPKTPAAREPKPKPEPKPKLEPKPKPAKEPKPPRAPFPEIKMSTGAGALFSNDGGGGMAWEEDGGRLAMPHAGGGAYIFFDAAYAEVFVAFYAGGGEWESKSAKANTKYDMQRSAVNIGAFAKYPIAVGSFEKIKAFPLVGIDYEASVSAKIIRENNKEYAFDGKEGRPSAGDLSALWVKFGGGVDADVAEKIYVRAELLYGVRTANGMESKEAGAQGRTGHGVTVRAGAGYRF